MLLARDVSMRKRILGLITETDVTEQHVKIAEFILRKVRISGANLILYQD